MAVIAIAIVATFITTRYNLAQARLRNDEYLTTVRDTTAEALRGWAEQQKATVNIWAESSLVTESAMELIKAHRAQQPLVTSDAQERIRHDFDHLLDRYGYEGFFIVGLDYVNLSSSRDENIDTVNLLANQVNFLDDVFSGESKLSLPLPSDVPLPSGDGELVPERATMFAGAPIYNDEDEVVAGLFIRINPLSTFTSILQRGRLGFSGETYAFSAVGLLLSESRFEPQLATIGLLPEGSDSILNISVHDPGRDLRDMALSVGEQVPQRLTVAAKSATSRETASNMEGFRDYRGVMVIGAWTWIPELGLGITSELDLDEALRIPLAINTTIWVVALVISGSVLFIWWISIRSRGQLEFANAQVNTLNENLEQRVELRTAELEKTNIELHGKIVEVQRAQSDLAHSEERNTLVSRLALAAYEATDVELIFELSLKSICEHVGWPLGHAYVASASDPDLLEPTSIWYRRDPELYETFVRVTGETTFRSSAGLAGRIQATQSPVWIVDVQSDTNFTRNQVDADIVVKGAFGLPIVDDGRVIAVLEFFTDTEVEQDESILSLASDIGIQLSAVVRRKRTQEKLAQALEDAEAASRAKSAFLTNMSHELRTPLNAIYGFGQLLYDDESLSTANRRNVEIMNDSSVHLISLIDNLLDLAMIESGKSILTKSAFSVGELLSEVEDLFTHAVEDKGLLFEFTVEDSVPEVISQDRTKLKQVLTNVVGNAIKYSDSGTISLRVSSAPLQDHKARLTVVITDQGIGISPENLATIFNKFEQADAMATLGTGLGLPISRQYARLMSGDVTVASELGKGSSFTVSVIVDLIPPPAVSTEESAGPREETMFAGKRILVVDDNEQNSELLTRLLTTKGAEVREASSGEAGLRLINEWSPDLVLLDIAMPDMDGLEVTRRTRADQRTANVKILAVTARAYEEDREKAIEAGVDELMTKPFETGALFAQMNRMLK